DRRPGHGAGRIQRRPALVRIRPPRGGPRRGHRLHGRLDVDGPGGRDGGASRRLPRLPGERRPARRGWPRGPGDALPACPPRRGDHVRGDGRPAEPDLRPVREPAPRPEGAAGRVPRPGGRGMTDAFERYKDALRRGHSAAQGGRFDEAIAAYQEAGTIAPDRAMPQSSLGGVLARMGRTAQALAAYDAALARAPGDEAALRGRAELLAMAGRRAEAADTLDRLVVV